jgi:hypothetical protein
LTEKSQKIKIAAIVAVSFALSFTVFFFTPIDLYLNNPADFVVDWRYLVPPMLVVALVVTFTLSTMLVFLWQRKDNFCLAAIAICGLALTFARYSYGSFSVIYPWAMLILFSTSALLIKPSDSRGSLQIDSETVLSHNNFSAAILETAGAERDGEEGSYFDIISGKIHSNSVYEPYYFEPYWSERDRQQYMKKRDSSSKSDGGTLSVK